MISGAIRLVNELFSGNDYPLEAFCLDKVFNNRDIILYGAGESSHWFVEIVMKIHGYLPVKILDRKFKSGDSYEGIPACSPDDYIPTEAEKYTSIVVICAGSQSLGDQIFEFAVNLGFKNIIFLKDIYEIHNPFSQPPELFDKGFYFYLENKENILSALQLFQDDESKNVFAYFLQTHMQRKSINIPMRPMDEQYFPKDIQLSKGYSRFVSCGAYDGDTVRLLNQTCGKVDEIVCFETEPALFERLSGFLKTNKDALADKIVALPCAVYSHQAMMKYTSATGLGSRISEQGDCWVQAVALDDILPAFMPSFISMDIEGAEPYALKGAENMIRKCRPDLAICVYHSPDHLWEIPLYLNGLGLGYRFFLRNYTSFTIETVLYATI